MEAELQEVLDIETNIPNDDVHPEEQNQSECVIS